MKESETLKIAKGERIITKGEKARAAYMVLNGEVRVFLEEGTRTVELALLGQYQIFGETAIFNGETNGANVEAITDCTLLVITPESLAGMLEETDPIIQALIRMLIDRLKATNEALLRSETREFMDIVLI
jgi:CRP/FNR family transcriptional regulator, cyclic AMP receptor protein